MFGKCLRLLLRIFGEIQHFGVFTFTDDFAVGNRAAVIDCKVIHQLPKLLGTFAGLSGLRAYGCKKQNAPQHYHHTFNTNSHTTTPNNDSRYQIITEDNDDMRWARSDLLSS